MAQKCSQQTFEMRTIIYSAEFVSRRFSKQDDMNWKAGFRALESRTLSDILKTRSQDPDAEHAYQPSVGISPQKGAEGLKLNIASALRPRDP